MAQHSHWLNLNDMILNWSLIIDLIELKLGNSVELGTGRLFEVELTHHKLLSSHPSSVYPLSLWLCQVIYVIIWYSESNTRKLRTDHGDYPQHSTKSTQLSPFTVWIGNEQLLASAQSDFLFSQNGIARYGGGGMCIRQRNKGNKLIGPLPRRGSLFLLKPRDSRSGGIFSSSPNHRF